MRRRQAFTIIELLVVMGIFIALCSLSIPLLLNTTKNQLINDLNKLETMIVYLRQSAMASGSHINISFDTSKHTYSFIKNKQRSTIPLSPEIMFGFLQKALGPPGDPKKPISSPISFSSKKNPSALTIMPHGRSTAGTIYITDKNKKIMGALTCGVSQVSYIRKYIYQRHSWHLLDG